MTFKRVDYQNGHFIADNGVGDYNFYCPATPDAHLFLTVGDVLGLEAGRGECGCGKAVGARSSPHEPYTQEDS